MEKEKEYRKVKKRSNKKLKEEEKKHNKSNK